MLSKNENCVMSAVYSLCDGTEGCLVSPVDILSVLPAKKKFTPEKIDGSRGNYTYNYLRCKLCRDLHFPL